MGQREEGAGWAVGKREREVEGFRPKRKEEGDFSFNAKMIREGSKRICEEFATNLCSPTPDKTQNPKPTREQWHTPTTNSI